MTEQLRRNLPSLQWGKEAMRGVPEGYKMSEVGVIPKGWEVKTIQELIDNKDILDHIDGNHGELYPRSEEFKESGVPYVGANDFSEGHISFQKCKYLSKERAKQFRKGVAKNGDVLFAHNATVGPVALLETKFDFVILSTTATYFRCNEKKFCNIFLQYVMQAPFFIKQYRAVMAQSTRFQVPITAQRKFSLVFPPLPEQQDIASALSDVDALITALEQLITKKCNIKQGAMQQLITGKRRLPGFGGGWEVKKLGEVLKVRHGKSQKSVNNENGLYPILATGGEIGRADTFLYNKPSVLIGRKGTIDVPQYMETPFWTIDTLFFTEISDNTNPKYIFYKFNLIDWYSYNEASGVPSLNASTIEKIELLFPPTIKEQQAIAQILSDMDAEIESLEQKRAKYKAIKQGMMQELLTGKTRLV